MLKNDTENIAEYELLRKYVSLASDGSNDVFEMLCAIAQNKKLDGLRIFKQILK